MYRSDERVGSLEGAQDISREVGGQPNLIPYITLLNTEPHLTRPGNILCKLSLDSFRNNYFTTAFFNRTGKKKDGNATILSEIFDQ